MDMKLGMGRRAFNVPAPASPATTPLRLGSSSLPSRLHRRQQLQSLVPASNSANNVPRWSSIVPDVPFTGDDQGSTIYTALANLYEMGSFDESQFEAETYAREGKAGKSGNKTSISAAPVETPEVLAAAGAAAEPVPAESSSTEDFGAPHRWQVVGMMALSFVLCNMDKVNMSVAVIPMAKELGWSATQRGLVSSSFFWGYSLTQIPAGWISTSIGGARVLMAGVALWSIGTLIAPPAAHFSLVALCATRVFVGLGEGLAPSSATNVMARLVPERERARAVTTVFGGLDVGSAVGLLLCGPLIYYFGWESVFYLFAVLGLLWCLAWPLCKPEQQDVDLPKRMIAQSNEPAPSVKKAPVHVPWGKFLRSPPVWAVIVAHFCYNWGYYTLLAWLPSYFDMALGLNVGKSSFLTLIPYIAMTIMTPFVGPVADGLVSRGWSVTTVRKMSQGIAFAGPALCMCALAVLTPATAGTGPTGLIVGIMSVAFALGAWARAGLYCNHQDLSPKYAAALLGLTNTAGALPGVLGVTTAGYLLDATGSWAMALFYPTAICQVFGLIVYTMLGSSERQDWD
ncbi:putative anion transporter 6, chloroplastic [Nannochloris sp. 'desiccata']|nr:putative anion transporter 6, chloroplastic [Chlorella desiccata (nom. nud.)]